MLTRDRRRLRLPTGTANSRLGAAIAACNGLVDPPKLAFVPLAIDAAMALAV
jgi:hypothetical protein